MTELNEFEKWLSEASKSAEFQDLVQEVESGPQPSEELLAAYHAGMLSPEEEAKVGNISVLSSTSHRRLLEFEEDIHTAVARSQLRVSPLSVMRAKIITFMEGFQISQTAVRFAGVAAVAAVSIIGVTLTVDRPPGYPSQPYIAQLGVAPRGVEVLSDGTRIVGVDPQWQLFEPVGEVTSAKWFVWRPVKGAETYTFELRSQGKVVYSATGLSKNHLKLPKTNRQELSPGREGAWILEARNAEGGLLAKALGRFTLISNKN